MNQWINGGYRDRFSVAADSDHLFLSRISGQMGSGSINKMVKKAAESAGIQQPLYTDASGKTRWKVTAHTLRHSMAVQSIKNGMNVRFLQDILGHADITTTERYLEVTEDDSLDALQKYGAGVEEPEVN